MRKKFQQRDLSLGQFKCIGPKIEENWQLQKAQKDEKEYWENTKQFWNYKPSVVIPLESTIFRFTNCRSSEWGKWKEISKDLDPNKFSFPKRSSVILYFITSFWFVYSLAHPKLSSRRGKEIEFKWIFLRLFQHFHFSVQSLKGTKKE